MVEKNGKKTYSELEQEIVDLRAQLTSDRMKGELKQGQNVIYFQEGGSHEESMIDLNNIYDIIQKGECESDKDHRDRVTSHLRKIISKTVRMSPNERWALKHIPGKPIPKEGEPGYEDLPSTRGGKNSHQDEEREAYIHDLEMQLGIKNKL